MKEEYLDRPKDGLFATLANATNPANVEAATVQGQATLSSQIREIARETDEAIFEILSPDMGSGEVAGLIEKALYRALALGAPGSAVRTVAAPSDSPSPKSRAVTELVEAAQAHYFFTSAMIAAANVGDLSGISDTANDLRESGEVLRSALEVVKTHSD